ncbi:enoyl-CoA hydratase/isomerase family protein [Pseudorhodoplanes sp.]|uniref:enoyl-CoA hydratase/isomerase family protein n=1 Tax=Pseudorhodoplanes sp. TaxID=1934341 RepID=UPI002C6AFEB5|nr:enoyl-CoA hydratase/isomerase family protein [Pseudorhodoplanes sp.]HWV41329.1 enoyl-CoA hydratase/isomerase family protein [Pseudorhodoplanes sp.]
MGTTDQGTTDEILFERRGSAGIVTLNRPRALNAITHGMVRALAAQLDAWRQDEAVTRVLVTANGERAFSAGGDIRALYELIAEGRHQDALSFFREEYALNTAIKRYPKPYISLIDGIVMGGGVGISIHGSHRVAGERYAFAMPEVGIGFFPDVGATYALPRLAGEIGTYLALTGERIKAADAVLSGAATHHVKSHRFGELKDALCGSDPVNAVLADFMESVGPGEVMPRRRTIDRTFSWDSVDAIIKALEGEAQKSTDQSRWSASALQTIHSKSPTSLVLALAQMRYGRTHSFEACMATEFRIVSRIVYGPDMREGVRAVIIDKDNAPRWTPPALALVENDVVARHFAALPGNELELT